MKLKPYSLLLLFCASVIFPACSQTNAIKSNEIALEEKTENLTKGVVLNDQDTQMQQSPNDPNKTRASTEPTVTLADKSELVTMWDGYGNKTETRYFKGHPRLQLVMVRTAANGTKQVIVYGYRTEVKMMTDDFAETALNAPATEIANVAELKATRPYKDTFASTAPTPQMSPQIRQQRQLKPVEKVETVEPEIQEPGQLTKNEPMSENEKRLPSEEN